MEKKEFATGAESTWCPGCPNFMVLEGVKRALKEEVENNDTEHEDISMVTGIGCHGKMFDYLDVGGVYSLHGRVLPTCLGMKIGNPNLTVLGFGGDGDTYSEGVSHFVHASRYNVDMTMIVHNNQVFALTTGQATPTSEKGFQSNAQPFGQANQPLNPLEMAITTGASFVARVYPKHLDHYVEVLREAVEHDGYALVDVAFPCLVYHNTTDFIEENMYKLEESDHDPTDRQQALEKAREWDYNLEQDERVPVGVLYRENKETFSEKIPQLKELKEQGKGWFEVER
ncbi:MAG: thiamine pyrophosphate-dependent enzyme [Candidatus Aenigmatarchaeota archaeon]